MSFNAFKYLNVSTYPDTVESLTHLFSDNIECACCCSVDERSLYLPYRFQEEHLE